MIYMSYTLMNTWCIFLHCCNSNAMFQGELFEEERQKKIRRDEAAAKTRRHHDYYAYVSCV